MNQELAQFCRHFIDNRDVIKKNFRSNYHMMHSLCAIIFSSHQQEVDIEKIKDCRKIIKKNTGPFSAFKGTILLALSSLLSLSKDPAATFDHTLDVYQTLRDDGFRGNQFLTLAAFTIAHHTEKNSDYTTVTDRAKQLYRAMREEHPLLTAGDDYGFAAMLAISERDVYTLMEDAAFCYQQLKTRLFSGNAVQSLSHLLALSDKDPEQKCVRAREIEQYLLERGCRFGNSYELIGLGILTLIDEDLTVLTDKVAAIDDFLKQHKGFGSLYVTKAQRLLFATALVAQDYLHTLPAQSVTSAVTYQMAQIILAMEIAVLTAIAVTATASSSSNSSG